VQRRKGFQQIERHVRAVPPLHAAGLSQRDNRYRETDRAPLALLNAEPTRKRMSADALHAHSVRSLDTAPTL